MMSSLPSIPLSKTLYRLDSISHMSKSEAAKLLVRSLKMKIDIRRHRPHQFNFEFTYEDHQKPSECS